MSYAEPIAKEAAAPALETLDRNIERLGKAIESLRSRLDPILNQHGGLSEPTTSVPMAEPISALHGRAVSVAHLAEQVEHLLAEVVL